MQLKEQLAIAAAALISGGAPSVQAQYHDWKVSGSVLSYAEQDRVWATEFIGNAVGSVHQTGSLDIKLVLDTLSGASANGAVAQKSVQTFTSPSGENSYSADSNQVPLDSTFKDTRGQVSVSWSDALTTDSRYTLGGNLSLEHDFSSLSVNGEYAFDFNQKNSTFSIGVSAGTEESKPEGGVPIAFANVLIDNGQFSNTGQWQNAFAETRDGSSNSITNAELLLGFTQTINRNMLLQFNLGHSTASGYLTDPYKFLSVLDSDGFTQGYRYENRPDNRTKDSFFAMTKYHFENSVFDISYRHMKDDWQVSSNTVDIHWHLFGHGKSFWEPHIRYYSQDAASFFTPYLQQNATLSDYASADYRLGKMNSYTVGLKYGFQLERNRHAEVRVEFYKQISDNQSIIASQAVTDQSLGLSGLELYPDVSALILQFSYYF